MTDPRPVDSGTGGGEERPASASARKASRRNRSGRSRSGSRRAARAGRPNRSGLGPRPRHIADILAEVFASRTIVGPLELKVLREAWADVIDPELASATHVVALKEGVLIVEVASSALIFELEAFHHERLLGLLRETAPGRDIQRIRFEAERR